MIKSFRHKGLKRFYQTGDSSKIMQNHLKQLRLILTLLNAATTVKDMNFPGSDLHRLKGDKKDFWAVRVSGNWRVIFRFENGDAYDVDYLDYH
jgi:proteic killer suppression protein